MGRGFHRRRREAGGAPWRLLAALLIAGVAAGCGADDAPADDALGTDAVLATAGEVTLTVGDFRRSYIDHLLRSGRNDHAAERWQHLERMVDAALLAEAARARGLDTLAAARAHAALQRDQALAAAYFDRALIETLPELSDADLRRAYARDQRRVVVRHALYPTREAAAAARARLDAGTPLVALAQEAFGQPGDPLAGFLGPVGYFQADDAFAEAAFALDVGAVSAPVRSRYGWHLIGVEDVIASPIVTEDGYQRRKGGLRSQLALRRRGVEGDRFVRAEMEALGAEVRPAAMRALAEAVADLLPERAPEQGPAALRVRDVRAVEAALAPETVLLTYAEDGTRRAFTAADFAHWLPVLPYAELRARPAAAVGRALRNEVFARRAEALGLGNDPALRRAVARDQRAYLADLLREALRAEAPDRAPDDVLRLAAARAEARMPRTTTATFWVAPFETAAAAEAALAEVEAGRAPAALAGYRAYDEAALADLPAWRTLVRQAPLGRPVVGGSADGWFLLRVDARSTDAPTLTAAQRDTLRRQVAPFVPEVELLTRLRAEAPVAVDTARFQALFEAVPTVERPS